MNTAIQKLRPFAALIPVVLMSSIIIGVETRAERCYGLADALLTVALLGILFLALVIGGIIQLLKIIRRKGGLTEAIILLLMILIAGIASWIALKADDYFQEAPVLKAEMMGMLDTGGIILRKNQTFSAHYGHVDWGCRITGQYNIQNDTLFLGDRIKNASNNIITSKYLIQDEVYLLPLDSEIPSQDSTYWMKITEINQGNWH